MNNENLYCKSVIINLPKYKWKVTIPKNGELIINHPKLSLWQRMWMRFIGWGVERI